MLRRIESPFLDLGLRRAPLLLYEDRGKRDLPGGAGAALAAAPPNIGQSHVIYNCVHASSADRCASLDHFLRARWTRARLGDRWTIVVFHHPVYTTGTYRAAAARLRPELPQLFQERGVDLILNGHDHLYFASKSLRKIRYVVTGGGGATLYRCTEAWYAAACQARNHFIYIVADPERITVRAVPTSGPPFHRFATTGR